MTQEKENYASTFADSNQGKNTGTKVLNSEDLKNYAFGDSLIRVTMEDDNPIFLANDVCNALGYYNPRDALARHCEHVVKRDMLFTTGRKSANFIYEPDLYALIFGSKLDTARSFQRWVFEEVLPSIRKTGAYRKTDINHKEVYNYNELRETMERMEARLMKIELIKPAKIPKPIVDNGDRRISPERAQYLRALLRERDPETRTYTVDQFLEILAEKHKPLSRDYDRNKIYAKLRELCWVYRDTNGYHLTTTGDEANLAIEETKFKRTTYYGIDPTPHTITKSTIRLTKTGVEQLLQTLIKEHVNKIIDADGEQQKKLIPENTEEKKQDKIIEVD